MRKKVFFMDRKMKREKMVGGGWKKGYQDRQM